MLLKRFYSSLKWYIEKAEFYRKLCRILTFIGIVFPLAAALLNVGGVLYVSKTVSKFCCLYIQEGSGYKWWDFSFFIASMAAALAAVLRETLHVSDRKNEYRAAADELKKLGSQYLASRLPGLEDKEDEEYLKMLETYMTGSHMEGEEGFMAKNEDKKIHWYSSKAKKEINESNFFFSREEYTVDERFSSSLKWYIRNACFYRTLYYTLAVISAVFPILAAALNNIDVNTAEKVLVFGAFNIQMGDHIGWIKIAFSVLSIAASIATIIMTTFRVQDKWTKYRCAAEELKRMRSLHLMETQKLDSASREFLKNLEAYMQQENLEWRKSNLSEDKKQDQNQGTA